MHLFESNQGIGRTEPMHTVHIPLMTFVNMTYGLKLGKNFADDEVVSAMASSLVGRTRTTVRGATRKRCRNNEDT